MDEEASAMTARIRDGLNDGRKPAEREDTSYALPGELSLQLHYGASLEHVSY
jgi:hypothetical protein